MNGWIAAFVVVVTVEIVLQTLILAGVYYGFRIASRKAHRMIDELQRKLNPILFRAAHVLEKSEKNITNTMRYITEMTRVARERMQTIDRTASDALEWVRVEIIRVDAMLTAALETVEGIGVRMRRSVLGPLPEASAMPRGIRTGIAFSRRQSAPRGQSTRREELPISQSAGARLSSESSMQNDVDHSAEHPVRSQSKDSWIEPRPQNIPRPTYSPAVLALGIVCLLWGMVTTYLISLLGTILFIVGLAGWIGELRHEHESR